MSADSKNGVKRCCDVHKVDREAFDRLIAKAKRRAAKRTEKMPTEKEAIAVMFDAWQRLKELGWREAMYCPKDGTFFDAIEAGSTGIHNCCYQGEWPTGSYDIYDAGDIWPSHPILFRPRPADDNPTLGRE